MRIKALTPILVLLGMLGLVGCGQGAISYGSSWAVVHKASNAGAITSLTIPATGTGNLIVVGLMFNGGTYAMDWTPRLRQSVKRHLAVRCKSIVQRD